MAPDAAKITKAIASLSLDPASRKRLKEIVSILSRHHAFRDQSPQVIKAVLEDLGPMFVKLGQMMSSHADVFPKEYCEALATLRSDSNPLPFDEVKSLLDRAYDGDYHRVFKEIDPTPLGSASIAQVHRATLNNDDVVVVKVQRDGVKEKITGDLSLLRKAVDILELDEVAGPDFDPADFIDELEKTTVQEIDFRIEAQNLADFYENNTRRRGIGSPKVYPEYSGETTLVMENIVGLSFDHPDEIKAQGENLEQLGKRIVENYVQQMLEDNLFHADPHSANILLRGDEIVWIDLGLVGRLSLGERELLKRMFTAVAIGDAADLKRTLLTWGHATGDIDHPRLLRDLDSMLKRYGMRDIANLDLTNGLNDLLNVLRGQSIAMPGSFTTLARGLMTLQGTVQSINPSINVVGTLRDYLKKDLLDPRKFANDAERFVSNTYHGLDKAAQVPGKAFDILDMLEKGEAELNMNIHGIKDPINALRRTIDRASLGVITAGLFVGSSMLCTTDMEPQILGVPFIGFCGYVCAFVLAVYIVFKVRAGEAAKKRSRKREKRL